MSFFMKIFQNKESSSVVAQKQVKIGIQRRGDVSWDKETIRLVVFKDHDIRGRSVVFDSKAVKAGTDSQACRKKAPPKRNDVTDCGSRSCYDGNKAPGQSGSGKSVAPKQPSDTKMLGEMMFGSVAMTYKGSSLKVHAIRTPPQLMITKLFVPSKPAVKDTPSAGAGGETESFDNYSYASTSSLLASENTTPRDISSGSSGAGAHASTLHSIAQSVPMAVPSPPHPEIYVPLEPGDSGISGSMTSSYCYSNQASPYPSPGSSASNSASNSLSSVQRGAGTGNSNSFNRRLRRSFDTSLELPNRVKDNSEHHKQPMPPSKRPPQYGIGIIFSLSEGQEEQNKRFEMFLFSHIMLIEGHVTKLKLSLEKCLHPKASLRLHEALETFRQAILDLYLAPRIREPVWLSMMTLTSHKVAICQQFLKEFMVAKEKYDRNHKFLSTLLTGVLTYHLAWVPTVAPAGSTQSGTYLQKHSAKWLDTLAKSHPYNPLWAQLGDMYGAIGFPLRLSRTVITGKKSDVIRRLLYILTYFIRCSEVFENVDQSDQLKLDKIEYASKSEEINIPLSGSGDKSDGSARSMQSYQTQFSCCVCTQCGKAIDGAVRSDAGSNVGSFETRSRLNSRGRLKSPTLPETKPPDNCDEAKIDLKRKLSVLKLMNRGMDITTTETVRTSGVVTVTASQSSCRSPPFSPSQLHQSSQFGQLSLGLDSTQDASKFGSTSTAVREPQTPADGVQKCEKDGRDIGSRTPPVEASSNTIWYVSLEEMGVEEYRFEPPTPVGESPRSVGTHSMDIRRNSMTLASANEVTSQALDITDSANPRSDNADNIDKPSPDRTPDIAEVFSCQSTRSSSVGKESFPDSAEQSVNAKCENLSKDSFDNVIYNDAFVQSKLFSDLTVKPEPKNSVEQHEAVIQTIAVEPADVVQPVENNENLNECCETPSNGVCQSRTVAADYQSVDRDMCSQTSALDIIASVHTPPVLSPSCSVDNQNHLSNNNRDTVESGSEIKPEVMSDSAEKCANECDATQAFTRVRIGSMYDDSGASHVADDVRAQIPVARQMVQSYRRILEDTGPVSRDAQAQTAARYCRVPEPTPVPLYPTLNSETIPENSYVKPCTLAEVEHWPSERMRTATNPTTSASSAVAPQTSGVYPQLVHNKCTSTDAVAMTAVQPSARLTNSLYPSLDDLSVTDKATPTCVENWQKREHQRDTLSQREETSEPRVKGDILSDHSEGVTPKYIGIEQGSNPDMSASQCAGNSSFVVSVRSSENQGVISKDLMRSKDNPAVTSDVRAAKSKSAPVVETQTTCVRKILLSCPADEKQAQLHDRIADDSAHMAEQTRVERVRNVGNVGNVGNIAAERPVVLSLETLDDVDAAAKQRDSGYANEMQPAGSRRDITRPLDSGVFELSMEASGEVSDPCLASVADPADPGEGPEVVGTRVEYFRLESSDSLFDTPCPDDSELPSLSDVINRRRDFGRDASDGATAAGGSGAAGSRSLHKYQVSDGVFDEYYDENEPVELPSDTCITEQSVTTRHHHSESGQHEDSADKPVTPAVGEESDPFARCDEKGQQLHHKLLSSLSSEIDASSIVTDSDLDGSVCNDCMNKMERSSVYSATSQGAKRMRQAYKRQASLPAGTPGRCRSVTPTELSRRRCGSSNASLMHDVTDGPESPTLSMQEVLMPSWSTDEPTEGALPQECNLGRSLLADYSEHYLSDFVLHGTSDSGAQHKLHHDLMHGVASPVLDERVAESVCIVADTDKWSVKLVTCQYATSDRVQPHELMASRLVSDILDSLYQLCKLKMSAEFCLMHVEDRLQEVYFKSRMLSEYLKANNKIDMEQLAAMLGFAESDIPLLLAVAGTHTPRLAFGLM